MSSSITLSCFLAKSYNFTLSSNIPLDSESSATNSMIRWVLVPWNLKYKVEKIIGQNAYFHNFGSTKFYYKKRFEIVFSNSLACHKISKIWEICKDNEGEHMQAIYFCSF